MVPVARAMSLVPDSRALKLQSSPLEVVRIHRVKIGLIRTRPLGALKVIIMLPRMHRFRARKFRNRDI